MTNCWFCGKELVWDFDANYDEVHGEGEGVVAFLHCPSCGAICEFSIRDDEE